ncbi:hypothetical protein [Bibersteinia trehalosi]|uniref:hypothetical protein n=1 Tax=Bibersteinia trehalosi TaxID=47735 RepID=UPI002D76FD43|nr:hypothetical protein [Bibersteinia trehalosi]
MMTDNVRDFLVKVVEQIGYVFNESDNKISIPFGNYKLEIVYSEDFIQILGFIENELSPDIRDNVISYILEKNLALKFIKWNIWNNKAVLFVDFLAKGIAENEILVKGIISLVAKEMGIFSLKFIENQT